MSLDILLPVMSKAIGRDLNVELNLFYRGRAAIGKSLNEAGQKFFIENWKKVADFMETPEGDEAIKAFMLAWFNHTQKPELPVDIPQGVGPPTE